MGQSFAKKIGGKLYSSLTNSELGTQNSELDLKSRRACKILGGFARVLPLGRPRAYLCQGRYYWLSNKPEKAKRAWKKSLAWAERLAMPYEKGLAHYEIARHLVAGTVEQKHHFACAREIFTGLGAIYELGQIETCLGK